MTKFDIRDENFETRIRESFERQGFMKHLGAKLGRIAPGEVEIVVPFDPNLSQQHGFFHGGLVGTIADNTGGYAAFTLMSASSSVLTVEYKLNLMAPAHGEIITARGRILRPGRRVSVCQSDVYVEQEGVEKLCATMLGTFMTLENSSDKPVK